MDADLKKQYSVLKIRMKKDAAEEKVLKAKLEESFGQNEASEKTIYGTFKMIGRKTWNYTEETKMMGEDLKIQQTDEQESAVATHTTAYSLQFTAKK